MRPQRLELHAFGPFASTVEIDFEDLADTGLFLIHGPTGSGKTTLLDALCFALYGTLPGVRDPRLVRSHHAEPTDEPRVVLDFGVRDARYRIERTPGWEAPKVRGEGTTLRNATAVLRRLDGDEPVIGTGVTEVNREIRDLVGLDVDQFQQVIMLPQGRFEQLLRANSSEREAVFETLFDTSIFKSAERWLTDRAHEARTHAADLRRRVETVGRTILDRIDEIVDAPPADGTGEPDESDEPDPADIDLLETRAALLIDRIAELEAETKRTGAVAEAAREALDAATQLDRRFDERSTLRSELAGIDARTAEIDRARDDLTDARAAEPLRLSFDELDRHTNAAGEAESEVRTELRLVGRAIERCPIPVPALHALDLGEPPSDTERDRVVTAVRRRLDDLGTLTELAETIRRTEADHDEAITARDDARNRIDRADERLERLDARIPELASAVREAEQAAGELPHLETAATAARRRADAATELQRRAPELDAARNARENARTKLNDRRARALDARERFLGGIAATLAAELVAGEACAVCGSRDHPDPAEATDRTVDRAELDRLEDEVGEADTALQRATTRFDELGRELERVRGRAGDGADDPEAATAESRTAEERHATASALAAELPTRRNAHDAAIEARTVAEAARATAEKDRAVAEQRIGITSDRLATDRATLARELPDGVELDAAVGALEAVIDALDRLADRTTAWRDARTRVTVSLEQITARLDDSPFADEATARSAMLTPAEQGKLDRRIRDHDDRRRDVTTRLASPELADLPDERPDLDAARARLATAERERDTITIARGRATAARAAVDDDLARHRQLGAELITAEAAATLQSAVADRCTGRTRPRVPLQRWVLATYLEEACEFANRRLEVMTAGRYRLRTDRIRRGGGVGGLELRVHDAHTDREREVSTLSGGETFQASLALALGVADSVTAHAGGIRIDAMFIDEGFGSLDADSLDLAMDELDRLRDGGRMVGIISHVAGLKERITWGIEIRRGDNGSAIEIGPVS